MKFKYSNKCYFSMFYIEKVCYQRFMHRNRRSLMYDRLWRKRKLFTTQKCTRTFQQKLETFCSLVSASISACQSVRARSNLLNFIVFECLQVYDEHCFPFLFKSFLKLSRSKYTSKLLRFHLARNTRNSEYTIK